MDDYLFVPALNREEWAWQFLRRNPDYRADHAWFIATWRALEADYGVPPARDFFRWRQDPRAWRSERELSGCATEVCPGQDDQVLIECWMGARWGLRKFPPDPAVSRPPGEDLAWREITLAVTALPANAGDWLQQKPGRMALGFDLGLPLEAQLEQARLRLLAERRALQRRGVLPGHRLSRMVPVWTRCLRLLDGVAEGVPVAELARVLGTGNEGDASRCNPEVAVTAELDLARRLLATDYRDILTVED